MVAFSANQCNNIKEVIDMSIAESIFKLRSKKGISQEKFAEIFSVSRQSVQKWENGSSQPDLAKIISIAKYFDVTVDEILFGKKESVMDGVRGHEIKPQYERLNLWELYCSELKTEYRQCEEEGLDIAGYKELFEAVAKLPVSDYKKRMADVIFDIVTNATKREGYPYVEPSELDEIRALRKPHLFEQKKLSEKELADKIYGAWIGRVCGCLLGKPLEGMHTDEIIPLLKAADNYPMNRYIRAEEVPEEMLAGLHDRVALLADRVSYMPEDDDTNYTVLYKEIVKQYGRDFTPHDVANAWLNAQRKNAYCTAERVAYCNFVKGYFPPDSAVYQNPFREWIGAQIRGDYFGYINPGNPEMAADMAWRDASVSHVKNGIYGEMFAAAMIACAAVTDDIKDIILGGLAEIPATSRLYEEVWRMISLYDSGKTAEECFEDIHSRYDEKNNHDWCHTISNAAIVVAALLYGKGDYGKSICMSVEVGFDTDCNGATVGSILGMRNGAACVGEDWTKPVNGKVQTGIFGLGVVDIKQAAEETLKDTVYCKM